MFKNLDNKQKIELAVTGLGIILIVFLIQAQLSKPQKNKVVSSKLPAQPLRIESFSSFNVQRQTPLDAARDRPGAQRNWGRDPFFPGVPGKGEGMEGLTVNGIVWDKDNPYAIINDDIVRVGDKIGGATVVEISEKDVVLEEEGERHTLELNVYQSSQ